MHEHRSGPRRGRQAALLAATAALVAGLGLVPPAAVAAPQATATAETAGQEAPRVALPGLGAGTHKITLVTGDQLLLTANGAGQAVVSVERMAPRPDGYPAATVEVRSGDGTVSAVPSDVRAAVDAGRVDRRLFDLAYLAEHDLLDAGAEELPLILRYGDRTGFAKAGALPASRATIALTSIDGAAVRVDRANADDFWTAVHPDPDSAALARGIRSVWLDGTAELTLDVSVPLIGAPQAWAAGLDGTGTTVAVLDTGADLGHPDLAGRIGATASFIDGETVQDVHGHGTHVATTIAGSGAASGGKYKGVAPGATLAIGKVCSQESCPDSATIAGMEWAAAQGVDVVSMSIGGAPSDGTDPVSTAVNELTAATGTLFVIAAGNEGPAAETVGAPGAAESALTVAATTKQDGLASFSSRGPRIDGALKPDIAAPGVDIVAGRAQGTTMGTPVDDHYTTSSGTSMATPHVSGAAAILAQAHPDWRAAALKAALMSTSKDVGFSVYERGAGRVDVARAVSQRVVATTTAVDFGGIDPAQATGTVDKQVTYANSGDAPVTLTLSRTLGKVGGDPVPGDAFTGAGELTVPAHGTATTTVTLDPAGIAVGRYSGAVTAKDASGAVAVTTPVALDRQPPKVELVVRLLDEKGDPACRDCGWVDVLGVDVPDTAEVPTTQPEPGVFRARVQPGTYSLHGEVSWLDPATGRTSIAYVADPQVAVTGDTAVTLDVRGAKEVVMRTPKAAETYGQTVTWSRTTAVGYLTTVTIGGLEFAAQRVLVVPGKRNTAGKFRFGVARLLANPQLGMRVTGRDGFDLTLLFRGYADQGSSLAGPAFTPWPATRARVELVDAGYGDRADLAGKNLRGRIAVLRWGDDRYGPDFSGPDGIPDSTIWTDRLQAVKDAGAIGYLAVSAPPAGFADHFSFRVPTVFFDTGETGPSTVALPEAQVTRDQGMALLRKLAKGRVQVDLTADPNVRYTYQLYPTYHDQLPARPEHNLGNRDLVAVDSAYHGSKKDLAIDTFGAFTIGQGFGGASGIISAAGTTRTDHYGPVSSRDYLMRAKTSTAQGVPWMTTTMFDRSGRQSERWFAPVTAPGVTNLGRIADIPNPNPTVTDYYCNMCREGNLLWPIWINGYANGRVQLDSMQVGGVRLYAGNGKEIPLVPAPTGLPVFEVPAKADTYRMTQEGDGKRTTWTFTSAAPARTTTIPRGPCMLGFLAGGTDRCAPLPLVYLGYDLGSGLRLDNTVKAGTRHQFTVFANRAAATVPMPKVTGLRVWTSTDDGKTWRPASVGHGRDGRYTVTADYPSLSRTTGAVSIKAEAWDAGGNRVEQVVDRAFVLAAR